MNLTSHYPVITVQTSPLGYAMWFAYAPDFDDLKISERVKPDDPLQEVMLIRKLRLAIGATLTDLKSQNKPAPPLPLPHHPFRKFESEIPAEDIGTYDPAETVSTTAAAKELGRDPQTIRVWVDAGTLTSILSPGGHRRIFRSSIRKLQIEMKKAAEMKKLEDLLKKKNMKRKEKRHIKEKAEKVARFNRHFVMPSEI